MERNIGFNDYLVRMVLTCLILATAATSLAWAPFGVTVAFMTLGVIVFISAMGGWCPIYKMLGIQSTANKIEKCETA